MITSATASIPAPIRQLVTRTRRPIRTCSEFLDHPVEVDAHVWGQIGFVDHEQIGANNARTSLAGNVVAASHVDDKHPEIGEIARECRGQIVATAFHEDQLKPREATFKLIRRLDIRSWILSDDCVGAARPQRR